MKDDGENPGKMHKIYGRSCGSVVSMSRSIIVPDCRVCN